MKPKLPGYRCIVVDPPWDQGKTGKRSVRPNQGAELDYRTMTIPEIQMVPVPEWAYRNAFLWLWATNSKSRSSRKPILRHAFEIMEHWGFTFYTMLTWDKLTGPCPFGPYQVTTEHCLFGYRGKCEFPKESLGKMKTGFMSPPTKHSEKPTLLYEHIARYFEGPRLDVFGRRWHPGFEAVGDQAEEGLY